MLNRLSGALARRIARTTPAPAPAVVRIYRSRNATTMVGSLADICRMLDERCRHA